MYPKNETDQSFTYLKKVVESLDEPICLLGGWAVYLTLNKKYQAELKNEYLGLITTKNKNEFDESGTRHKLGISTKKLILVTLGRIGKIEYLVKMIVNEFSKLSDEYVLKIQIDPYLDKKMVLNIKKLANKSNVIISNFSPNLIEEINIANLVIARGGYNIVSEILLTGTKAILFPEIGRTEEEVYRCEKLSKFKHIKCFNENNVNEKQFVKAFKELLSMKQSKFDTKIVFDNKTIAKKMLDIIGEK